MDARDASRLAERLNEVLASGHTAQWAQDREADLDALPDETCPLCGGSGERHPCTPSTGPQSKGTQHMIGTAHRMGLGAFIYDGRDTTHEHA